MGLALVVVAVWGGGAASGAARGSAKPPRVDDAKPILEPDGPLRGVVMTGALPEAGPVTEWRLAFTTADREATAIIGLGSEARKGARLRVAWYRVDGPGKRTHLFSQRLKVRAGGGLAYSQGVAERGLAPGSYEIVATLGKRQVRVPWVVRVGDASANAPVAGASRRGFSAPGAQASTLEDWELPTPGEQGWYEPEPPAEPSAPGPCTLDSIIGSMSPMTDVRASAWYLGSCSSKTLTASVTGAPVTLASSVETEGPLSALHGAVDVCTDLAGGSDLPGTVVHLAATGSDGATLTSNYTLPDLGEIGPVVGIQTSPPAGTRVDAGDTITVSALALLLPPALGVKVLYLSADDELLESVPNLSGSTEPVPCDLRRNVAVIERYRYEVPDDPPPIVTLTADAADFQDRRGEHSTETVSFPTIEGELWQGTISGGFQFPGCGAGTVSGRVTLAVEDGAVSGTSGFEGSSFECASGTSGATGTVEGVVTGRKTRNGFELTFGGGLNSATASLEIRDERASGAVRYTGPNPEFVYFGHPNGQEITLECTNCRAEST
jgi:hypothetical protein